MKFSTLGLLAGIIVCVSAAANLLFVDILEGDDYNHAIALNASVTAVNTTIWAAMSTSDFASYDAIIIGDPFCGGDPGVLQFMVDTKTTVRPLHTTISQSQKQFPLWAKANLICFDLVGTSCYR
jgi:hypothetical protein